MKRGIRIYTDGGFNPKNKKIGYAFVAESMEGQSLYEKSGLINKPEYIRHRNITGEVYAVGLAIQWAKKMGFYEIEIVCDYTGCINWGKGNWKTNFELTRNYAKFIRECGVLLKWRLVKGHSGEKGNERADLLCRKIIGIIL